VVLRLVDGLALHILCSIKCLVEKDLEEEELADLVVDSNMDGVDRMLMPTPATAAKRDCLRKSISLLRECRELNANTMDKVKVPPPPTASSYDRASFTAKASYMNTMEQD
jgi:hypothetical protein